MLTIYVAIPTLINELKLSHSADILSKACRVGVRRRQACLGYCGFSRHGHGSGASGTLQAPVMPAAKFPDFEKLGMSL